MSGSNVFVKRIVEDEELKVAVTNIQNYDKTFKGSAVFGLYFQCIG